MEPTGANSCRRFVEYDALRRRVWIFGQRCHHGATGTVVAALACLGFVVEQPSVKPRSLLALAATGGALMAHDWKDHALWFKRERANEYPIAQLVARVESAGVQLAPAPSIADS
ncbi:MAG: hypothetical protein JOZ73_04975 [Solirubrobacterales bacterium]|nr:hypothetical protein [Solirubrobacterales bacterium]